MEHSTENDKEEETMKKRSLGLVIGLSLLAGLLAAAIPAWAQDVDQKIKALEDELTRLKEEQAQVKAEQIEMRKQATEAAAALPNFSYRPGGGMLIEAADKSWSSRASIEAHFRILFESGLAQAGRETGGGMGRRVCPGFFCILDWLFFLI